MDTHEVLPSTDIGNTQGVLTTVDTQGVVPSSDTTTIKTNQRKRRGRPKKCGKGEREKRNSANTRERNRMRNIVRCLRCSVWYQRIIIIFFCRAYERVRERLPNNEDIVSKKQIINKVV